MPSIFSKCYRLCNTCSNTCSQLLHLSLELQKKDVSNTMKPTIVIVPCAWQNIECYESLRGALSSLGYGSICRSPPSTTLPHGDTDLAADVTSMPDSVLQPLLVEEKDFVLLMHSFSGLYGGASVRGLSRTERAAQCLRGGVIALVYKAIACVASGITTLERMGRWGGFTALGIARCMFFLPFALPRRYRWFIDRRLSIPNRNLLASSQFQIQSHRCSTI